LFYSQVVFLKNIKMERIIIPQEITEEKVVSGNERRKTEKKTLGNYSGSPRKSSEVRR